MTLPDWVALAIFETKSIHTNLQKVWKILKECKKFNRTANCESCFWCIDSNDGTPKIYRSSCTLHTKKSAGLHGVEAPSVWRSRSAAMRLASSCQQEDEANSKGRKGGPADSSIAAKVAAKPRHCQLMTSPQIWIGLCRYPRWRWCYGLRWGAAGCRRRQSDVPVP
jgi:hypothetical protein